MFSFVSFNYVLYAERSRQELCGNKCFKQRLELEGKCNKEIERGLFQVSCIIPNISDVMGSASIPMFNELQALIKKLNDEKDRDCIAILNKITTCPFSSANIYVNSSTAFFHCERDLSYTLLHIPCQIHTHTMKYIDVVNILHMYIIIITINIYIW